MADNKNRHISKGSKSVIKKAFVSILTGSVTGTIVFFLSALIISFLLYKRNINQDTYGIFILIPAAVSGFFCGYSSAALMKSNGFAAGLISVLPMFFIIAAAAMFISKESIGLPGWTALGVMSVCAGGAGIISVSKKSKKTKLNKKLKKKYK